MIAKSGNLQLQQAESITEQRKLRWRRYHDLLAPLEAEGLLRRPIVPSECTHNAHMYYVLIKRGLDRQPILDRIRKKQVWSLFHYVPLHSSPAGRRYGRAHGNLAVTEDIANRLVRLPLWVGLTYEQQDRVVEVLNETLRCSP